MPLKVVHLLKRALDKSIFIHKLFIRTYLKAPIVQHYTYNTIKTINFGHISCTCTHRNKI